jgi:hypothetical protein
VNTTSRMIFCLLLGSMTAALGAIEVRSEVRKFVFADGYPTGKLTVEKRVGAGTKVTPAPIARGNVSVFVPPGSTLVLEINPHCLEHPEKLATMPTDGIDEIDISYMSMDDDVHVCDKALAAMPLFKKPLILNCLRTDVTDLGLTNFKSLSMVSRLNCFLADLDGSFLTGWKRMQNLENLNLANNSLKSGNLKNLVQLKGLRYLDLRETTLSDEGLQDVCKNTSLEHLCVASNARLSDQGLQCLSQCSALENLNIAYDRNITDKSITTFLKLPHLKSLNLSHTKISEPALEKLKGLKLNLLVLPDHYREVDMVKLQKAFPSTVLRSPNGKVSSETQIQFAPLNKQF